jgi:hypothetical protein
MKQEIIRKALVLLGASSGAWRESDGRISKAENLCEEFATLAIEETFMAIRWPFALKRIYDIEGAAAGFKEIDGIDDCLKVAVISPSNLEWYIEEGRIYFKGNRLESLFYYSKQKLERLLCNDRNLAAMVPESFRLLSALSLSSQTAFAMYSDSLFADGLRKQYLLKSDEARRIYSIDYNLVNSGEL